MSRAFTFKQQCQRSDQTLRTFFGQIQIGKNDSENNEFRENFKNTESDSTGDVIDNPKCATDQLDSQLDLDSLPAEIESDSFEEDIELSNLTSSLDDDDIERHLNDNDLNSDNELTTAVVAKECTTVSPSKCDDYFDEIKLDVGNVVSLTDNQLPDQSIDGTFGEYNNFRTNMIRR